MVNNVECLVNILKSFYTIEPFLLGDNSDKLCELCTGKIPGGRCTSADPYAGYQGAFRCLVEAGDVAFLKHTTVTEMTSSSSLISVSSNDFELLCKDGSRRPVSEYMDCNWGRSPSDAVVVSSLKPSEVRSVYQDFLLHAVKLYSNVNTTVPPPSPYGPYYAPINQTYLRSSYNFTIFESAPRYGDKQNLLLQVRTLVTTDYEKLIYY